MGSALQLNARQRARLTPEQQESWDRAVADLEHAYNRVAGVRASLRRVKSQMTEMRAKAELNQLKRKHADLSETNLYVAQCAHALAWETFKEVDSALAPVYGRPWSKAPLPRQFPHQEAMPTQHARMPAQDEAAD